MRCLLEYLRFPSDNPLNKLKVFTQITRCKLKGSNIFFRWPAKPSLCLLLAFRSCKGLLSTGYFDPHCHIRKRGRDHFALQLPIQCVYNLVLCGIRLLERGRSVLQLPVLRQGRL